MASGAAAASPERSPVGSNVLVQEDQAERLPSTEGRGGKEGEVRNLEHRTQTAIGPGRAGQRERIGAVPAGGAEETQAGLAVGVIWSPVLPSACTRAGGVLVLALSCDLSFSSEQCHSY